MLELKKQDQSVSLVLEGSKFSLPDGRVVSPAYAGWESDDGYFLVEVPVTPPDPAAVLAAQREAMRLTFAQLLIGLVTEAWITEAEGEAWLAGTLPAAVLTLIATLPTEQQFPAKARAIRPSEVLRLDPLVQSLGAAQGKTAEELDTFFTTYAQV